MLQQIYPVFIKFHIIFSVLFILIAIAVSTYSAWGWRQKKSFGITGNRLKNIFLSFLVADLFFGIILYFFLQKPDDNITASEALKYASLRFWAIQHFSNVMFVLILSFIGNIFILRTQNSIKKFKYAFLYFGISTLIIVVSVSLFALRK
jgi:hypothetical protein